MATTYNFTNGSITGQDQVVDTLPNTTGPFVRSNIVDFANQTLDVSSTDVAQVLNVPADTWVMDVSIRTITAETANASVLVGYGGDTNQWATAFACTAGQPAGDDMIYAPHYFATADTIDFVGQGSVDLDAYKCEVIAVMVPGNKNDSDGRSTQST